MFGLALGILGVVYYIHKDDDDGENAKVRRVFSSVMRVFTDRGSLPPGVRGFIYMLQRCNAHPIAMHPELSVFKQNVFKQTQTKSGVCGVYVVCACVCLSP